MARLKRSSRLTFLAIILAVALTLRLAVNVSAQVSAPMTPSSLSSQLPNQWNFTPPSGPGTPVPVNRESGASRGEQCIPASEKLIALVPELGYGDTTAEYPTLFWYMPKSSASAMDFVLQNANQEVLYSMQYTLEKSADGTVVGSPGIKSLALSSYANFPPLEIGQVYSWGLALICDDSDRSSDVVVKSGIRRVAPPDPTFAARVQQAAPLERVGLYAKARLWYDTLATLVELKRTSPNSNDLAAALSKLLTSVGLEKISQAQVN